MTSLNELHPVSPHREEHAVGNHLAQASPTEVPPLPPDYDDSTTVSPRTPSSARRYDLSEEEGGGDRAVFRPFKGDRGHDGGCLAPHTATDQAKGSRRCLRR
jgi:hypothetical protein